MMMIDDDDDELKLNIYIDKKLKAKTILKCTLATRYAYLLSKFCMYMLHACNDYDMMCYDSSCAP